MEKTVKWFAAAAGAVAGLFMRMPIAVRLLVLLMGLDYLSGVGVALLGKSPKSEGGALSSRAGFAGLMRKAMILIVILLAAVLDNLTGSAACTGAAALLRCDYDVMGMALILALYLTRKDRAAQCIAGAVFTLFEPVAPLAFGLVWFYSGERGGCSRAEQWAFYWFYPVHLFLLAVLTNLLLFQK